MSDKLTVTVDEKDRTVTLGFAIGALSRSIVIDLADMKTVVDGFVQVFSMSQQHLQGQLNGFAQRLEVLENLSKDDLRYLADLVRENRRELRSGDAPAVDNELANKLDLLAKA
jgi:hypothetical protein